MNKEKSHKPTILIIEDDPDGRRSVEDAMQVSGYHTLSSDNGENGIGLFKKHDVDVILSDIRLPDINGLEILSRIRQLDEHVPILLMTAYGTVSSAVTALKSGAYDYILKPLDLADIQTKVARAIETRKLRSQISSLKQTLHARQSSRAIITRSDKILKILKQIKAITSTQASVLIVGESGTGKELVAHAIHFDGNRADSPFVAVNCGAFSESLLESELFGHEKGAFTGAVNRHEGAFERAIGGTLFLDEIGIAPGTVQTRLLRVLEEREVLRVGGTQPIPVDVRVISATNRNPDDLVAEKIFRHDLLYRLQVVTIRIPPLRERPEDIRPLADHFVAAACANHGKHIDSVAPGYYEKLDSYYWPGNVRELNNVVESSVIMASTAHLTPDDIQLNKTGKDLMHPETSPENLTLAEIEKKALSQSLNRHKGSRQLTAKELGISTRTIQRKIKEYDLPF